MSLIDPSNYKTLILTNDIIRNEFTKYELPHKETRPETQSRNHNAAVSNSTAAKKSILVINKQFTPQQPIETNQNIVQAKSINNYINITEDYKYEYNKNLTVDNKIVSNSVNNYSAEEKILGNLQNHITRNHLDHNANSSSPKPDLIKYHLDNYLPAKGTFALI